MYTGKKKDQSKQIAAKENEIRKLLQNILSEPLRNLEGIDNLLKESTNLFEERLNNLEGTIEGVSSDIGLALKKPLKTFEDNLEDNIDSIDEKVEDFSNKIEGFKEDLDSRVDSIKKEFDKINECLNYIPSVVSKGMEDLLKKTEYSFDKIIDEKVKILSKILQETAESHNNLCQIINEQKDLLRDNFDKHGHSIHDMYTNLQSSMTPISEKSTSIITGIEKVNFEMNEKVIKLENAIEDVSKINRRNKIIFIVFLVFILIFSFSDGIMEVFSLFHK